MSSARDFDRLLEPARFRQRRGERAQNQRVAATGDFHCLAREFHRFGSVTHRWVRIGRVDPREVAARVSVIRIKVDRCAPLTQRPFRVALLQEDNAEKISRFGVSGFEFNHPLEMRHPVPDFPFVHEHVRHADVRRDVIRAEAQCRPEMCHRLGGFAAREKHNAKVIVRYVVMRGNREGACPERLAIAPVGGLLPRHTR